MADEPLAVPPKFFRLQADIIGIASKEVYCVIEGSGFTEVNGKRIDWERNDIFVVPGWQWHRHCNNSDADACLYSVSDTPVHHKLHMYREQTRADNGEITEVWPWPYQPGNASRVSNCTTLS